MYDILNVYLENGLRVVMHRIPHIRTMACGIWVKHGSKYEEDDTNGLSHLIEHLIINDANNNNPKFQKVIEELSFEGVIRNAGTTKEHTNFYFSGLSKNLEKSLIALSEMVKHNKYFSEELLENEKKVVVQEAISYYSSFNQIKERTSQALYGNMGVGRIIVGSLENVKNTTNKQITKVIQETYTPENSTLVIIGGFDYDKTLGVVNDYFECWEDTTTRKYKEIVESDPGIFFNSMKNSNSTVISVGFKTGKFNSQDRTITETLCKILGNPGLDSRLFKEIRSKRGLAYTLGGFNSTYENNGVLGFTAVCAHKDVEEITKIMVNEIRKVKEYGVTDEEVSKVKKVLETQTMLELDNLVAQLNVLGKSVSNGDLFFLEKEIRNLNKVKKEDLKKVAEEIFTNENISLAAIGDFNIDKTVELLEI